MSNSLPNPTSGTLAKRSVVFLSLTTVALLAVACLNGGQPPGESPPPAQPTSTDSMPGPPTDPPTAEPTADPGAAIWATLAGMWSGCPADAGGGLFLDICPSNQSFPIGPFITLYLPPTCTVGETCGVYIKGAFSSEFIPFALTLEGYIQGRAQFHADSGTGMFEGMDRTLYVDVRGGQLNVEESEGETYILSPGCNPVIDGAFGCLDTMPG